MSNNDNTSLPSNVLFYSPKCPFCIECLKLLQPYADQATFLGYVNIHVSRHSLPLRIRRVPTLILNDGEIVYVGKQVHTWILKYINIIDAQIREQSNTEQQIIMQNNESEQEQHQQQENIINNNNENEESKNFNAVYSTSTLVSPSEESMSFSPIDRIRTLSETIDYSKVRNIESTQVKVMLSPESIQDRRNTELQKIRPHPGNRFSNV